MNIAPLEGLKVESSEEKLFRKSVYSQLTEQEGTNLRQSRHAPKDQDKAQGR